MSISLRRALLLCLVSVFFVLPVTIRIFAQDSQTGSLSGTALKSSGQTIPMAEVIFTNNKNSFNFTTLTDDQGRFLITKLPPGAYGVKVVQDGFRMLLVKELVVAVGSNAPITARSTIPPQLIEAKTVYVVSQTSEKSDHSREAFVSWGRFRPVDDVEKADLVVIFAMDRAPEQYTSLDRCAGCHVPGNEQRYVQMAVYDRRSRQSLYASRSGDRAARWNDSASEWSWFFTRPARRLVRHFREQLEKHLDKTVQSPQK